MAMDGSFSLRSEMDRFLARCPKLRSVGRFSSLLEKGHMLNEEEVVDALVSVFLHPDYTLPMMGCFRAIAGKIVDKAVTLLSLVPNLGSNAYEDSQGDEVFMAYDKLDGVEEAGLIEFYSKRGRGLDLHELACFAFYRILDLAPHLKSFVEYYYDITAPPFARIPKLISSSELSFKAVTHLVFISQTTIGILLGDPELFAGRWNWSCFLDLLLQFETLRPSNSIEMVNISYVRWCSVQILSIILKLPNLTECFGARDAEALLRWQEFCRDTSVEKAGWYSLEQNNRKPDGHDFLVQQGVAMPFASELLEIEPLKRSGRHAIR
ncbi:hypothetical protein Dimus_004103 [Dionaea muscipula]